MVRWLKLGAIALLVTGLEWGWVALSSVAAPGCDPAYPTVCIPSPPPDLDCKDVKYRNFQVLSPDPHRFDGDKDGIGCERKT